MEDQRVRTEWLFVAVAATLALAVLVGLCSCDPTGTGPQPDASPGPYPPSWYVHYGDTCSSSETYFCEQGAGMCILSTCLRQCSPVDYPRCPADTTETHGFTDDGAVHVCVCVPS